MKIAFDVGDKKRIFSIAWKFFIVQNKNYLFKKENIIMLIILKYLFVSKLY